MADNKENQVKRSVARPRKNTLQKNKTEIKRVRKID
jgi:hypothetical protein